MERGSAELRAYRDEAARLEAARRERAVHSQRMQRNAEPLTQNEVAGCWGTLGIWFIFPSFACYMLERRGNDRVGLCCGSWFLFCFLPCPDDDNEWHMTTINGLIYYRTCDNDKMFHSCCCNVIRGPYPEMEDWHICHTAIRLIPC